MCHPKQGLEDTPGLSQAVLGGLRTAGQTACRGLDSRAQPSVSTQRLVSKHAALSACSGCSSVHKCLCWALGDPGHKQALPCSPCRYTVKAGVVCVEKKSRVKRPLRTVSGGETSGCVPRCQLLGVGIVQGNSQSGRFKWRARCGLPRMEAQKQSGFASRSSRKVLESSSPWIDMILIFLGEGG